MASTTNNHNDRTNATASKASAKKKKKSGLSSILAAFCGGAKGHEPEAMPPSRSTRPATQAPVATAAPVDKQTNTSLGSGNTQPLPDKVGKSAEVTPSAPDHLAGVASETQTAVPTNPVKPDVFPDVLPSKTAKDEVPNSVTQSTSLKPTEDAGRILNAPVLSDNGHNNIPNAGPTVVLAPPLLSAVGFNERVGGESPAQELGMTDVEMGREHSGRDQQEEVVVQPHGISEGVKIPLEETEGLLSAAVQPPGSGPHGLTNHISNHHGTTPNSRDTSLSHTGSVGSLGDATAVDNIATDGSILPKATTDNEPAQDIAAPTYPAADTSLLDEMDEEDRLIAQGGIGIPIGPDGSPAPLLPPVAPEHKGRKCLVLDLDETLLHSSFKMISSADYIVPVEIESQTHNVYVVKRPGVDNFLLQMGKIYEIVVFTASLSKYADPVLDILDIHSVVKHRLFRESCYNHKGNYVKDLSQLGREMSKSIIIDNSPASYIFHPNNAVPVSTWFNDPHDTELTDLCPFLTDLETVDDIRGVLDGSL